MNNATLNQMAQQRRLTYRAMIDEFSNEMLEQLMTHEQRGRFNEWRPKMKELSDMILKTQLALSVALANQDRERIKECTADMANLMMKLNQLQSL